MTGEPSQLGPQIVAGLIFLITFSVILSERVHRTIAAMIGAAVMLAAGLLMGFYSQAEAWAAVDFNTLGLLLGMMILVSLLEQTGFFQYIAVLIGQRSHGNPWLLLVSLGTLTTLLSLILDNVTTIVLIAPITVLLAEILGISPIPMLIAAAVLSNTGGVATLVGDPPNVLIGSAADFSFSAFITHLAPVVFVAWMVTLLILRLVFRRELAERPAHIEALQRLDAREGLHDPAGMRRILIVLGVVVLFFFLEGRLHLAPATIALSGAAAAMLWVRPDVDKTLHDVEWSVLLFFGALFVTTGGLEASGLLQLVAGRVAGVAGSNLLLASLGMLWTAAIVSAVVDNIPFTIAMIPVIQELGGMGIAVIPIWWALALGAGFGGNGTPIGSTANVITVSISERTRKPITARLWARSGLPVMIATCIIASLWFIFFFSWMQTR